jgi:hypothetical protein
LWGEEHRLEGNAEVAVGTVALAGTGDVDKLGEGEAWETAEEPPFQGDGLHFDKVIALSERYRRPIGTAPRNSEPGLRARYWILGI